MVSVSQVDSHSSNSVIPNATKLIMYVHKGLFYRIYESFKNIAITHESESQVGYLVPLSSLNSFKSQLAVCQGPATSLSPYSTL